MRVLQINKFFYRRGGVEAVVFDTINGLRARGHEVIEFSMVHPNNLPSEYSSYFVSPIPELVGKHGLLTSWRIFKRLFYSREVKHKLEALVLTTKPQVAHLHGVYHHLSASTFTKLRALKIPVVLTLHDFFPLCPNRNFLHGETLAEELFKKKLYNCVRYKCVDNRLLPSIAGTLEAYYYRLRKIWKHIDLFICPSQFMADKMVEYGFPRKKMRIVPNALTPPAREALPPLGSKIVYLGRLHYEKGIKIFMEAVRRLAEYEVVIAGTGSEEAWVENCIRQYNLVNVKKIGWVGGEQWEQVMAEARVSVVPSLFYENCSLAILEALSYGRLVVAVNRGGTPELIDHGVNGLLARPEDPIDLAAKIQQAMQFSDVQASAMAQAAVRRVNEQHCLDDYLGKLEKIYQEVITKIR